MTGRHIPRVTAPLDERLALAAARQRLHDDPRLVPSIRRGATREREKQSAATRQDLWAVRQLALFHTDQPLGRAAFRRNAHDAPGALSPPYFALGPAHYEKEEGRGGRDGDWRASRCRDASDRPIGERPESDRAAVR